MRTREAEAAHWFAVRHLMRVASWGGAPRARAPGQFWPEAPEGVSQERWDALVDAEVAPFVGQRVFVVGDRLVPESAVRTREVA
jgi:hypothetical protein